jgi:hypothetical protein
MVPLLIASAVFSIAITKKVCDHIFPTEMHKIYMNIAMYGLKIYVPLYLSCEKIYNRLYKSFVSGYTSEEISILCINNGKLIHEISLYDIKFGTSLFEKYDLIFCKEPVVDKNKPHQYNYIRLFDEKDLELLPEESTFKFMDVTVFSEGKKYKLNFTTNNFYMEGNVLFDQVFLHWYLKTYFQVELASDYICSIMDQNINFITVDANNHILIKNNDYIIQKSDEELLADEVLPNEVLPNEVLPNEVLPNEVLPNEAGAEEDNNYSTMKNLQKYFYTIENTIY